MRRELRRGYRFARKAARWALYRPFRPNEPEIRMVDYRGSRFAVLANEDVGWRLVSQKEFESAEVDALLPLVEPDDMCVDVGANVGIYTVLLAKRAAAGHVAAFEPVPLNRDLLRLNLTLNGIENASVAGTPLSEREGEVEFTVSADGAFSSLRSTGRKPDARKLRLEASTLDRAFAAGGRRVAILKIDVEGAELLVLRGGEEILKRPDLRPRAVMVELNATNQRAFGYTPADVVDFLRRRGYEPHSITPDGVRGGWPHPDATEDALFLPAGAQKL